MLWKQHGHQAIKILLDMVLLGGTYGLAFLIRFEGALPPHELDALRTSLPFVLLVQCGCLIALRVPSRTWRHVSLIDMKCLLAALGAASCTFLLLRLAAECGWKQVAVAACDHIPLGVVAMDFCLGFLGTAGLRIAWQRWSRGRADRSRPTAPGKVRTLLLGAGRVGGQVVEEAAVRPDLCIEPVGFLDDDPAQAGKIIHGVRVLGTTADLGRVVASSRAEQVLITLGDPPAAQVRRITRLCEQCGVPARIIPGISAMVAGKSNGSAMRDVALEDLLHRKPVQLDAAAIAASIQFRRIAVTGAGGSIGSELCREVCRFRPATLLLIEQAENSLFNVHRQLAKAFPDVKIVPLLADVCDASRVREIFKRGKPHVVFHAAAHKHVPMMEWNPGEAVKNNILGTRCLAEAAAAAGVGEFVFISTDKAVNPTSIMGVSKRVAELYLRALAQHSATRFMAVRFGNVLGSSGSVIPLFKEQIARGGPVTVTHPEMKRYFMTIPEACQLVLQAASMGNGGELFILDMGEPLCIVDLARDLIRLSGLAPDDVRIEFVGLRPGEKLHEELSFKEEGVQRTPHARIFVGRLPAHDPGTINRQLDQLRDRAERGDGEAVLSLLKTIVPEYEPSAVARQQAGKSWHVNGAHVPAGPFGNGLPRGHAPVITEAPASGLRET
jgi:FlaA1/EpsC-like NDP-sugar epimerase